MTRDRVLADELYAALEGMLYIAAQRLHDSPRREDNRLKFLDIVERLLEARSANA